MVKINFSRFEMSDHRANRLHDAEFRRPPHPGTQLRRLYSNGPQQVLKQLELFDGLEVVPAPPGSADDQYRWRITMPEGDPSGLRETVKVMQEVLTLAPIEHLDLTLALDWYKNVQEGVDAINWPNTDAGELNRRSKYFQPGHDRQKARRELLAWMVDIVQRHQILADCGVVMSTPGSSGDGRSHGEMLAGALAEKVGRWFVQPTSNGPRAQRKEGGFQEEPEINLVDTFAGEHVLIVDDVLRSGTTMRATALAARHAGAGRVVGLVVARTMRS